MGGVSNEEEMLKKRRNNAQEQMFEKSIPVMERGAYTRANLLNRL